MVAYLAFHLVTLCGLFPPYVIHTMGKVLRDYEFEINYYFNPPCYIVRTNKVHLFLLFTGRHISMLTTATCIQPWQDSEWTEQSYREWIIMTEITQQHPRNCKSKIQKQGVNWQKITQHATLTMMMWLPSAGHTYQSISVTCSSIHYTIILTAQCAQYNILPSCIHWY